MNKMNTSRFIQWLSSLITVMAMLLFGASVCAENSTVSSAAGTGSTNAITDVRKISFSTPFNCDAPSRKGMCLADSFKVGLSVVLLKKDNSGVCAAKTVETFSYEGASNYFEVTRLEVQRDCSGPFSIAVVGVIPSTVRFGLERLTNSVVKKYDEQARELLDARQRSFAAESNMYRISGSSPDVIAADGAVLLAYTMEADTARGPYVLFLFGHPFVSKGWCTSGHTIFYVNNRAYLGYVETGCGGGEYTAFVFDLSSDKPKEVYTNSKFST